MYELKPTLTAYSVELPKEDYVALWDWYRYEYELDLDNALGKLGCLDVDYNPHFGYAIYFSLEPENDTPQNHTQVIETIKLFVEKAKRWEPPADDE